MNLVSIQGKFAPGMHFKGEELHVCHQLIRSLSDNRYLVISSRYRTDILYDSQLEKNQSIIRLWCLYKGKEFDDSWLQKFFRTTGRKQSLEHYFTRLLLLKRIPTWYDLYMKELATILSNNEGKVSRMVEECLQILTSKKIFAPFASQISSKDDKEYADTISIVSAVLSRHNEN